MEAASGLIAEGVQRSPLRPLITLSIGFALLLFAAGFVFFLSIKQQEAASWVRQTLLVVNQLDDVQTLAIDAETGQRGYLLTGRLSYLEPFNRAEQQLPAKLNDVENQLDDSKGDRQLLIKLRRSLQDKMTELKNTIDFKSSGHPDQALSIVNNDIGKVVMDGIRANIAKLRQGQSIVLEERTQKLANLNQLARVFLLASIILVIGLGAVVLLDGRRRLLALASANKALHLEASERRAAESQVRQLQKMEAIGQLTGGIAHDFNNMLAIVIGFLDLAKRRLEANNLGSLASYLDRASEGANRAIVLTRRLLAFSRQQPLEPTVLNVNALLSSMSDLLRRAIGESIGIETVFSGGIWKVFADPSQLENALVNLAVNSRDAMPNGGKLTIETSNADLDERYAAEHNEVSAGQYVMISVSDTGVGMLPTSIERAFDPFFTTKEVGKGTGLGLSQVFGFVKQSKGHVKIYSELERGTSVKIYLPRYHGPIPANPEPEIAKIEGSFKGSISELILVVEDEARVRLMTVESLRELGYSVVHASLPSEALNLIDKHPSIAMLLTDIVMPEMSGRQLAELALAKRPDLKVLYTTGYTRNAIVHNGVIDPGTAFVAKPFTLFQLGQKVRKTLDG